MKSSRMMMSTSLRILRLRLKCSSMRVTYLRWARGCREEECRRGDRRSEDEESGGIRRWED